MNSLVYWQLMLFLCATSFRETSEKVVPGESPRCTGLGLQRQALRRPWEQSPSCEERKPAGAGPNPRGAPLCPPPASPAVTQQPGLCAPGSRQIPAPRGAVLVQREKDLSTYNWNSFGLRYGKRQAVPEAEGRGCQAVNSKPLKRAPSLRG
ncbi:metastasis-suppressor KiSS-1 [Talpa occidentalis]|uniref:metastasis-suppressor KiSS-1 n=1 Tax=Talpa occidentalis TaxID=50954 RepID=UPI00188E11BF|nr:metastasis-suppressor KiSS-1 [Talpa occidentalis]